MFKLRSPFVYVKKEPRLVNVRCFSCGKDLWLTQQNIRVVNYCGECR